MPGHERERGPQEGTGTTLGARRGRQKQAKEMSIRIGFEGAVPSRSGGRVTENGGQKKSHDKAGGRSSVRREAWEKRNASSDLSFTP